MLIARKMINIYIKNCYTEMLPMAGMQRNFVKMVQTMIYVNNTANKKKEHDDMAL